MVPSDPTHDYGPLCVSFMDIDDACSLGEFFPHLTGRSEMERTVLLVHFVAFVLYVMLADVPVLRLMVLATGLCGSSKAKLN